MRPRRQRNNPPARGGREGVALMLALVFIALLSVLVFGFMYEMEVSASLAANHGADFQAMLAAKSAVANGISLLADDLLAAEMDGEPPYDSMLDASQWAVGLPFEPLNEAMMRTSISDEYGKINLNALVRLQNGQPVRNEELINALRDFFSLRSDSDRDPVDAIIDWVDYEDMDSEEPEGAENDYYLGLENPYACKNGPMDSIEELLLIKGITPELYFGNPEEEQLPLSEYLTVNGDPQGRVNVNTAPEAVLACIIGGFTGNQDSALAQQIYDEARLQPYEDLSRLSGFISPSLPGQTGSGRPGAATGGAGAAGAARNAQKQLSGGILNPGNKPATPAPGTPAGPPARGKRPRLGPNGQPLNARQEEELRRQETMQGMFRVNSNVFRIYGDGMVDQVLVRIEAYVWRAPLDLNELETMASNLGGSLSQEEGVVPREPFRIIDWKVIR